MVIHVTRKLVVVMKDANLDIVTPFAAKSVHLDISEWPAKNSVAGIVLTNNHVTISVESVLLVVRMDILEKIVKCLANLVNMEETVLFNAPKIATDHVDTLMDYVEIVKQVGRVLIAQKNVYCPLALIASINAVSTVSIGHVTK